jgi:exopolysaccharide biosynthesis polyprenyl glycosylphosphotransferase
MIKHRTLVFRYFLFLGDFGATVLAFLLAYLLRGALPQIADRELFPFSWYAELFLIIIPVWALVFFFMRLYEFWRGTGFWKEWGKIFQALLMSFFILGFFLFLGKYQFVGRIFLFLFFLFSVLLVPLLRLLIRRSILSLNRQNGSSRVYMIVGIGENGRNMARKIERHRDIGLKILGFLSPNETVPAGNLEGHPVLGGAQDLAAILENQIVDEVIFAISQEELNNMGDLFLLCEERGITARVILDFFPHNIARTHLEELDGIPLLTFSTTPKNEFELKFRRALDFAGSLVLIVGLFPVFLLIILLIRLDSRGPALYKQIRCGINGRKFWFYKFRSMVVGAENLKKDLAPHNIMNGPVFKMERDPRITRVGRFLRKTSLDELPQLFNVLRGDMSFVGPRPLPAEEVAQFKGWQRRRLSMKPGITGLWQVSGRNLIDFEDWMKLDLEYIDNWSLWLDFKILLKTIPSILIGKGAM